jgi:Protein of unknown function (DUF1236)
MRSRQRTAISTIRPRPLGCRRKSGRGETTGQAPQNERRELKQPREGQHTEPNQATEEQNRATQERINGRNSTTVGQGAAPNKRPNANLSGNIALENRTRMHDVFIKERSAPRVAHVGFNLSVGMPVPRSVHIVAVPREIIEIEPQWRGYEYFIVGDEVVIVNPSSMEIVAIIEV